jgi:DNA-3-methyladenine glycosylase I
MQKCSWAMASPLEERYHDLEWGVPEHRDQKLFEFLILEGAQAGLSWRCILEKRDAYRAAFDNFDPVKVAAYDDRKIQSLLENAGIVRNRLKISATVENAKRFLEIQHACGSFAEYLWGYIDHRPLQNSWCSREQLPAFTPLSVSLSKDLQKRGFKFVGKTICYAYMQAIGMVNDHTVDCYRHQQLQNP